MPILTHLAEISVALPVTLGVAGASAIGALALALAAGSLRLSSHVGLRVVSAVYVEVFRGTSALVQLFWFFYVLPMFGLRLSAVEAGVAALALNYGAYGAEVVRGSIMAVPRGQIEAGIALNLTAWQRYRLIVLPQAIPLMLPQAGNLLQSMIKATSLLSLVTIQELTSRAQAIRERTGDETGVYLALLGLYFVPTASVAVGMWLLERWRARRGGRPA